MPSPTVCIAHVWRGEYLAAVRKANKSLPAAGRPAQPASASGPTRAAGPGTLTEARELNLPSMSNALPMPAALGFAEIADEQEYKDKLRAVWDAKDEAERGEVWKSIGNWAHPQPGGRRPGAGETGATADGTGGELVLMLDLSAMPLRILATIDCPARPAEMHFLAMYAHLTLNELPKLAGGEPGSGGRSHQEGPASSLWP